jgi:hypothetical protein
MGSVLNDDEVASLARLCELIVPGSARVGPVHYIQAKASGMPAPVVEMLRGAIASLAPHAGSAEALGTQVDTQAFGFIRSLAIEAYYGDYASPGYRGPTAYDDIDFNSPQARRVRKDWSFLGPGSQT